MLEASILVLLKAQREVYKVATREEAKVVGDTMFGEGEMNSDSKKLCFSTFTAEKSKW